jgi:hypothetical protein
VSEIFSKELVPLYTALAWIVFWTGLLVFARKHLSAVCDAVASRVRAGSSLTVGPVTIEEPPRELKDAAPGAAVVSNTRDPDALPQLCRVPAIRALAPHASITLLPRERYDSLLLVLLSGLQN